MSDFLRHECGIALIRLKKPFPYYFEKYGTVLYGLNKLYLLMEKQHNRGQDGVGLATIKLDPVPGMRYISRKRSNATQPIPDLFQQVFAPYKELAGKRPDKLNDPTWVKKHMKYAGEVLLGHLRYGTHGNNSIEACHPFLRQNNWMTRNLVLAGNFNMTNVTELFHQLMELGQHPKEISDTVTVMEKIGHFLDAENQRLFDLYKKEGFSNARISELIAENLDVQRILQRSVKDFDGGYVMAGMFGHGDAFVVRDPVGIRPAFWFEDDELAVVASERPALQTVFNKSFEEIREIKPGYALIIKHNGTTSELLCKEPEERKSCSFERIYFSRGTDAEIYQERKMLGKLLVPKVLKAIDHDFENTIFSFIPNTAEVAYYGLLKGLEREHHKHQANQILALGDAKDLESVTRILSNRIRVEKIAIKDVKMRTFIAQDNTRDELVSHVYDVTYGIVRKGIDTIVVIDDSIVRGTTLQKSILSILDRLGPKKIIIVSSAPQIRYPDCYGIDMSKMNDFIAFRAMIALLNERDLSFKLKEVYHQCLDQKNLPAEQTTNLVKQLYDLFTEEELSAKISEIVRPTHIQAEIEVIYQSIDQLHLACPTSRGDWYFSGVYPTLGGNKVVNRAFINFMEGRDKRAY